MTILNRLGNIQASSVKMARRVVARGRLRFLVRNSLIGTCVTWGMISIYYAVSGKFEGIPLEYIVLMEAAGILVALPFMILGAYSRWRRLEKIASMDSEVFGNRDATGGSHGRAMK